MIDQDLIGFITHWVTESSIRAVASFAFLRISYRNATSSDGPVSFNSLLRRLDVAHGFNAIGLGGSPWLEAGSYHQRFADGTIVHDTEQSVTEFIFYNIAYTMPTDFMDVLHLTPSGLTQSCVLSSGLL